MGTAIVIGGGLALAAVIVAALGIYQQNEDR